jgi:thiamine transport system substrate-binding protein
MQRLFIYLTVALCFALAACQSQAETPAETTSETSETVEAVSAETEPVEGKPTIITMMSHDSFNISEAVLAEFEAANNAKVELLPTGDAGAALNQAILSKNNPLADVFFGVDNTFLSRAVSEDVFEPYASPLLADIPDALELDPEHRLLPVDFGDVCLNYDKAWFAEQGLAPPASLEDLADPAYKSLTVVENPATSSPGLAFLLATIGTFGEDGYQAYWQSLRDNDVLVTSGWEDAYWGQFSGASDGERPIVVSYASSPPAEIYFAETPPEEAPTAAVVSDGTCFRQIEFVGILKGTAQRDLAEKLIDFMLGQRFQEDIPLQMFVFPANQTAALPDVFTEYSAVPENPAIVSPEAIEANREAWLEGWTEVVLR